MSSRSDAKNGQEAQYRLRQIPEILRRHHRDGSVGPAACSRLVGGFSFDQSQFNPSDAGAAPAGLVVQAVVLRSRSRQWLHAVDGGDGFADLDQSGPGAGVWTRRTIPPASSMVRKPCGSGSSIRGTLMTGASRAGMVGMPLIAEYSKRFGVNDDLSAVSVLRTWRGETHDTAHDCGLFDVCEWRTPHQADPDRPHSGPLRTNDLQARSA